MLLLKIGWADGVDSLDDIKLDQWWMGIIAFIFGAKATQSFFESKMAVAETLNRRTENNGELTSGSNNNNDVELPFADITIISEAIKEKGKEWVESFPYVTGLSVRNKITDGADTKKAALIFKVIKKVKKISYGNIPAHLVYNSKSGDRYKILTDVVEESITKASVTRKPPQIVNDSMPFPLGNSISRKLEMETGSIGLVVNKINEPDNDYIVSCYHVFCAPELKKGNRTFEANDNSAPLICASEEDRGTNLVAHVVKGELNGYNDFAVAKVRRGIKIESTNPLLKAIPSAYGFVFPENEGELLTLCGRTSGVIKSNIKSHAASQTIHYPQGKTEYIQGLIEVNKFSDGGDSGGVVINSENKVVGLLIADSPSFSYVLPVRDFLVNNDFKLK